MNRSRVHIIAIAVFTFLVYSNTLENGFHFDDYNRVVDNPGIQKVFPITRHFIEPSTMANLPRNVIYRPLLPLSFSLNYAVSGESLPGYHFVNISIHALSAIIVYFLCLELLMQSASLRHHTGRQKWLALSVSAVFAVHPVSGYPVNYISGRDLLLMQFFLMSSLLCYVRMCRLGDSSWKWFLTIIFFALSLLSKKNAMVMPGLILLYEWIIRKRALMKGSSWLRTTPFIALIIGYLVHTLYVLELSPLAKSIAKTTLDSRFDYAVTQMKLHLFHYGYNFIWPLGVMEGHYIERASLHEPGPWLGLIFILFTFFIAWRVRKTTPIITFSILAYWVLMLPTSSIVVLRSVGDYRPYPSSVFLYLAFGTVAFINLNRNFLIAGCLTLLTLLSAATLYLNTTWKTEESFWERPIKRGGSVSAHVNYALSQKDWNLREQHLLKALELKPGAVKPQIQLGLDLIKRGKPKEGLRVLEKVAAETPSHIAEPHYSLAQAYKFTGNYHKAAQAAVVAANILPVFKYQYEAASLLFKAGQTEESVPFLKALMAQKPDYLNIGLLLGLAHQKAGRLVESIEVYQNYLLSHPRDYQGHFNLAYALMTENQCMEAVGHFNNNLELKPDFHVSHLHLATCHKSLGNSADAAKHLALWNDSKK